MAERGDQRQYASRWPGETPWFRAAHLAVRGLLGLLFRLRVTGGRELPRGPAVVVANHPSATDPIFLAVALPERIVFLAAAEYLSWPLVGWAMRAYGCIPLRRGEVDSQAIREALGALEAGRKVAVFPEGRISPQQSPGRRGAALLASRAQVPLVPVAMIGTDRVFPLGARFPRLRRVEVRVGPPLPPPGQDHAGQEEATSRAMGWIAEQAAPPAVPPVVPPAA